MLTLVRLLPQEKHSWFYIFHFPVSISKVQKEELLSSDGSVSLFSDETLERPVLDFQDSDHSRASTFCEGPSVGFHSQL